MNWEAIGAIGQMLGSVAVLVTLGYVAIQIRHSRAVLQGSITLTRAAMIRDQLMVVATDEGLGRLLGKARTAFGGLRNPFVDEVVKRAGLTVEEANRVSSYYQAFWQIRSESIRYLKELPASEQKDFDKRIRAQYSAGSLDRLWYECANKTFLGAHAVRYLDDLLAQPG